MHVDGTSTSAFELTSTGPWFDHEYKLPNRPLFRNPEALALWKYTVPRPLVEGAIMTCIPFQFGIHLTIYSESID